MAKHRPLDDLGPDFEQRWKQSPHDDRRTVIAELRDLYSMLEKNDAVLLSRLGVLRDATRALQELDIPLLGQGLLFTDAAEPEPEPAPTPLPRKENPFLPRSVLDRLHASQHQVSAGIRDLVQGQELVDKSFAAPLTPRQAELERELRLRLGPIIENLVEAQLETLKSELRVRLRVEMDRLIAEQLRK